MTLYFSFQEVAVLGVASGLSEQGLKCRGHRHEEVMRLQQEALSELRSRIRALELNWPISEFLSIPGLSHWSP